ncbi:MAG: proton-conducting transporter membrane subunit [Tepidisphaerales bacterium]
MAVWLLIIAVVSLALSGVPGLFAQRNSVAAQRMAAGVNIAGSAIGLLGLIVHAFSGGQPVELAWAWGLPVGQFAIGLDNLSLVFLIPIWLISALGSIYGLGYWSQAEHPNNARRLRLFWGLLTAGMALVVLARDGVLFLMAWEIMALSAFFLVATEDKKPEVRQAAWVYLVATHAGTLCLIAFFSLLSRASGSFSLWPTSLPVLPDRVASTLFIVGVIGFSFKAGLMPLHIWLPGAHANAPSHVSAVLSGVLLKTGIYGIIRVSALSPHPPVWWGTTLLIAGAVSGVLGIAFALAQHDLKRLLAYSSIENVGIITMGIGLALLGRTFQRIDWVVLGLGGALLHVLNHSLFKPLMFMGAGGVLHATHTRQIDLLGGLGKLMPRTFVLFVVGALAICGLPPLNGFVSELLIYVGLFRTLEWPPTGPSWPWAALAAPALALIGALAVGTFVKLAGIVFGGAPRSSLAAHAHDPGNNMLRPMILLAGCCALIGLFPVITAGILNRAIIQWEPLASRAGASVADLVPFKWVTLGGLMLIASIAALVLCARSMFADRPVHSSGTWDCGYARPTARMQYTGASFSQLQADLFGWILWPRKYLPRLRSLFSGTARYTSEIPDTVLDRCLWPLFRAIEWLFAWARPMQQGKVHVYLLYILAILLFLLVFARP